MCHDTSKLTSASVDLAESRSPEGSLISSHRISLYETYPDRYQKDSHSRGGSGAVRVILGNWRAERRISVYREGQLLAPRKREASVLE